MKIFLLTLLLYVPNGLYAHNIKAVASLTLGSLEASCDKVTGTIYQTKTGYASKKLTIKTTCLDTQIEIRNQHMLKFLKNTKYPRISMSNISINKDQGSGELFLAGIAKPVSFKINETEKQITTMISIMMKDFQLERPSYLGMQVKDPIDIFVTIDKSYIIKGTK